MLAASLARSASALFSNAHNVSADSPVMVAAITTSAAAYFRNWLRRRCSSYQFAATRASESCPRLTYGRSSSSPPIRRLFTRSSRQSPSPAVFSMSANGTRPAQWRARNSAGSSAVVSVPSDWRMNNWVCGSASSRRNARWSARCGNSRRTSPSACARIPPSTPPMASRSTWVMTASGRVRVRS